jgi:hypothetical protein
MQIDLPQDEVRSQPIGAAQPFAPARPKPDTLLRQGMLGLVVIAAIFNALTPIAIQLIEANGPWEQALMLLFMPVVVGVFCGEIGAMACWLVWGEGPFLRRLLIHWSLALGMGLCLVGGVLLVSGDIGYQLRLRVTFEGAARIACVIPAVSLAVQLPLWPFRTHLSWRVAVADDRGTTNRGGLSIRDILVGTAIVAVSLGLIRFLSGINPSLSGLDQRSVQNLIMMQTLASGLMLTVASFVLLIPALILLLRSRSFCVGVATYFGAIILSIVGLVVFPSVIFGRLPQAQSLFAMFWGSIVFAATVASPLFVWRACGYRLVWARDRKQA